MTRDGLPQGQKKKVFISYSSASRERVGVLANALDKEGFEVWWDHALNPGEDYRQKIGEALATCDAAVVAWSPGAATSDWVISEAERLRHWNRLVPSMIEACTLPQPFDVLHTADLTKWKGARSDPRFQKLVEAVRAKAENREPKPQAWRARLLTWGGAGLIASAVLGAAPALAVAKQTWDAFANPAASAAQVAAINGKIDLIMGNLKAIDPSEFDTLSQDMLRPSLNSLATSQNAVQRDAADRVSRGDRDGALAQLRTAATEAEKASAALAETYRQIGALAYPDRTDEAIIALERAQELDPKHPETRMLLGNLYRRKDQHDKAAASYAFVLETAGATDDMFKARALGNLGLVNRAQGHVEKAIQLHTESLQVSERIGNQEGRANQLGNLGLIARDQERYSDAIDFHTRAIEINRQLGRQDGLARQLGNLALAERAFYRDAKKLGLDEATTRQANLSARDHFKAAMEIQEKLGDIPAQARQSGNYGLALLDLGLTADAEVQFAKTLALHTVVGNREGQAIQLDNLGLSALKSDKLDLAEAFFVRAMAANLELDRTQGVALQYRNLGDVAHARAQLPVADAHWRRSLLIYSGLKNREQEAAELTARLKGIGARVDR